MSEGRTISIDGAELHYRDEGSGPALVMIHGLGSCGDDWEDQAPAFAPRFRVIRPDLRGHGASRAAPGPHTIGQFASDLREMLGALAVERATLLGISMGGAVALQVAADAPEVVENLVLVNTLPEMTARGFADRLKILERLLLVKTCSMTKLGKILVRRVLPGAEHEALRERLLERFALNDKRVYQASLRSLLSWRITERLPTIGARSLVVAAELDYTPVSAKQVFVERMPDARLVVIPDARHAVSLERPGEFNRTVMEFLGAGVS